MKLSTLPLLAAISFVSGTASAEHFVPYNSPLIPAGLRPGDSFHLVFVTKDASNRLSEPTTHPANINYFNDLVNTAADASTIAGMGGPNWFAIVSTRSADAVPVLVHAVDNAVVTAPVYRVDGARVASGPADFWDGALAVPISVNQNGVTTVGGVWSGCQPYNGKGLADGLYALGGGVQGLVGNSAEAGGTWLANGSHTRKNPDTAQRYYALSEVITIATPPDADADGLPDWFELAFTNPSSATALDPNADGDQDGLTSLEEYNLDTRLNPTEPDTDSDGLLDGSNITVTNADPRYAAWAAAGIAYFDNGTQRTFRGETSMGTHPINPDSDGDTLLDGAESNTGVWVSSSNTGTNPLKRDTDGDALPDNIETNTGVFVSRKTDTGTSPLLADTDGDGAGDWYEVTASFTDPNGGTSPAIPYPLPKPDNNTPPANNKPVKVFILSGQSNMVGIGYVTGPKPGSLDVVTKVDGKFPNLLDSSKNYLPREDVWYEGVVTATAKKWLAPGCGNGSTSVGPELGFGQVMGWYHDEPVLVIKASQGNRGLGWDILPPGSPRHPWTDGNGNAYTYAGYGDSPNRWLTAGGAPGPGGWYGGKQYDDFFLHESDMGGMSWAAGIDFKTNNMVRHNGWTYISKSDHTSAIDNAPQVDGDGKPVASAEWNAYSIDNAADVLDNFATKFPQWATQGFEIAGFGWWQGHWDQSEPYASKYEENLVRLINTTRAYYETRYPGRVVPTAPYAVATIGFGGVPYTPATNPSAKVHAAQLAVGNPSKHPAFAGNVKSVDTLPYWRELDESPGVQGYHYNNNAETYLLVGDALGRLMVEMLEGEDIYPPVPNPATFAIEPAAIEPGTIGMVATTATDRSGPVEYFFEETSGNPGGTDSGWQTSPAYQDSGLTDGLTYTYRVRARDAVQPTPNQSDWSAEFSAIAGSDTLPPAPNPMSFAELPTAQGENSITMTAGAATDINGVEYFFQCTVGGGPDSGWQDSTVFTATGLTPSTSYTYVVLARDKSALQNTTSASAPESATTDAPDSTPPVPDPMSFATPPTAQGENTITMTATTGTDPSGVEYFFEETSGNPGGTDSGWQSSPVHTDTGLSPDTTYSYRVSARDQSPLQNTTAWSDVASATTDAPDVTAPSLLSLSPTDNAADASLNANLEVTFDEAVIVGSGSVTIKNLTDSTQTVISVGDATQVTFVGAVMVINPTANLLPGKNYAVRIDPGAVTDASSNAFVGINDDTTWNFTSEVVPYIWTQTGGGTRDWTTGANWLGGNAPNPVAGDTVDFSTVNITANTVLTLEADRTARLWKFGDTSGTQTWAVNAGHAMILAGTTPTIQVNNATTTLNNGVTGTEGLTKTGGGTLALANTANNYSGGTTVNAGTLNITGNGSLGAPGGAVTFAGSSTFGGSDSLTLARDIEIQNGKTLTWGLKNATVNGAVTGNGTLNLPTGDASGTTSFLSTANTFTGAINMGSGIFRSLFTVNSLGDAPGAGQIRLGSATGYGAGNLTLGTGASAPMTFNHRRIDIASPSGTANLVNNNATATNIITVNTDFLSTPTGSKTLVLSGTNTGDNLIAGVIVDGNGTVGLRKTGTGRWLISGNNTYSGKTVIQQGTLSINSIGSVNGGASAIGNPVSAANGIIELGNAGNTGTLRYTGSAATSDRTIQVNSSDNTNTGGATIQNDGSGPLTFTTSPFNIPYTLTSTVTRTLTLGGVNGGTIQGVIRDISATGKIALTKSGNGTWTISGDNTYTGATVISGGKLFIDGDQSTATGNVSVSANATLGGRGTLGAATTIAANGKLEFDLSTNAASHDKLELAPDKKLTFSGASELKITTSGAATPGLYTLVTAPGGITGNAPATIKLPAGWEADPPEKSGNDLVINIKVTGTTLSPYEQWAGAGNSFDADANNDGIANGMAWVLGAANPSDNAISLLPGIDNSDATYFTFTYRRSQYAAANTTITAEYGGTLRGWSAAVHDNDNIIITETPDGFAPGIDKVEVKIKLGPSDDKLFARLKVVDTTP